MPCAVVVLCFLLSCAFLLLLSLSCANGRLSLLLCFLALYISPIESPITRNAFLSRKVPSKFREATKGVYEGTTTYYRVIDI